MFGIIGKVSANYTKLAYDFEFNSIDGNKIKLNDFKNKVLVVVNVASRCGYTPQYEDLQNLWSKPKILEFYHLSLTHLLYLGR